jgi:hypothetical protein
MEGKSLEDICELFDCTIMTDFMGRYGKNQVTGEDLMYPVYCIGSPQELGAGLRGFSFKHHECSVDALRKYYQTAKGWGEINREAGNIFPDWDAEHEKWLDD